MDKWEYYLTEVWQEKEPRNSIEMLGVLNKALNDLGELGWELVGVQCAEWGFRAFFKRPKMELDWGEQVVKALNA